MAAEQDVMPSRSGTVIVEERSGWAILRIARAAKRNALDRATRLALLAALDALRGGVRAVVLTGTDRSFCAGLDLKERAAERQAGRPDSAGEEAIALNMAIRNHPAVFIAAVNGLALGAGVTLINFCDLAIMAEDAELGTPEIGFATYASMAGPTSQILLNRKRAAWMLLATDRITAREARDWGLVNELSTGRQLLARASELAARIAGFDPVALAETKKALDRVPAEIAGWHEAIAYGQTVNRAIGAVRSATESPT